MRKEMPWFALIWIILAVVGSAAAPLLTPYDPIQPAGAPLEPIGGSLLLGSDQLGRDLWTRLVYGGRATLSASFLAASITICGGIFLGLAASLIGGLLERLLLLLFNATMAVPGLLLAMLFVGGIGPGFPSVILAAGLSGIPGFARLVHSQAESVFRQPYIEAARALGAGRVWLYIFHILPNLRTELLSFGTTYLAWAFTGITTLNFLGLAGDPSIPEWGVLLNTGRSYLIQAPQLILLPGVFISLTILSIFSIGEWLSTERVTERSTNRVEIRNTQEEAL